MAREVKFPDYEGRASTGADTATCASAGAAQAAHAGIRCGQTREGAGPLADRPGDFRRDPQLGDSEHRRGQRCCLDIAADAFEGLTQLADLGLNGSPCGAFETRSDGSLDRDDDYRTLLVMPNRAVAQQIRKRDQCSGQCVVVARDEVN